MSLYGNYVDSYGVEQTPLGDRAFASGLRGERIQPWLAHVAGDFYDGLLVRQLFYCAITGRAERFPIARERAYQERIKARENN